MPSKKTIKRRIKSVGTTKHIMKAMNMVAASKLQKGKAKLNISRPLYREALRMVNTLRVCEDAMEHVFFKRRPVKNALYVVISSDRGLCGGYNTNVSQVAYEQMSKSDADEHIIAFGSKGRDFFRRRRKNIIHTYPSVSEVHFFENSEIICDVLLKKFLSGEVDEVYIAFTNFETALSYEPKIMRVLPLGDEELKPEFKGDSMLYEPNPEHFIEHAVTAYLTTFIYDAMLESNSSEQASRMIAMDSATKNASDIIDDLTLMYNRIRQSHITQEITEIVSGANVTK